MFFNEKLEELRQEITPEEKAFDKYYYSLVIKIKNTLEEKGWTQKEFAEKLGKQPSEISKWLNGGHNLTLKSIAKMEVALGEVLMEVELPGEKQSKSQLKRWVKAEDDQVFTEHGYTEAKLNPRSEDPKFAA